MWTPPGELIMLEDRLKSLIQSECASLLRRLEQLEDRLEDEIKALKKADKKPKKE